MVLLYIGSYIIIVVPECLPEVHKEMGLDICLFPHPLPRGRNMCNGVFCFSRVVCLGGGCGFFNTHAAMYLCRKGRLKKYALHLAQEVLALISWGRTFLSLGLAPEEVLSAEQKH